MWDFLAIETECGDLFSAALIFLKKNVRYSLHWAVGAKYQQPYDKYIINTNTLVLVRCQWHKRL